MYSPYLQDLCLFVGQSEVYNKGALLLDKLARISATGIQIHRIVESHSEPISTLLEEEQPISSSIQNGSLVYDRWKYDFNSSPRLERSKNRSCF